MHNNGFLIRATFTVIDHRAQVHDPVRPRKLHFEELVEPGENLYEAIRKLAERVKDRAIQDVVLSPMGKRAKEIGEATDNKEAQGPLRSPGA